MENQRFIAGLWISSVTGIAMSLMGVSVGSAQSFFGLDLTYDSLFLFTVAGISIFFAGELITGQVRPGVVQIILTGAAIPTLSLITFIFFTFFLDAVGVVARTGALNGNLGSNVAQSMQLFQTAWLLCEQYAILIPIGIFATWSLTVLDSILCSASDLRESR